MTISSSSLYRLLLLLALPVWSWTGPVCGDMLIIEGESAPRYGRVLPTDEKEIVLFEAHADQNKHQIRVPRENIQVLIVNIDVPRLEKLAPENWSAYRDYAEELAAQRQDPVARDLAIRLYLIAAAAVFKENDDSAIGLSALAGLTALARTEKERKDFEVLRFIHEQRDHLVSWANAGNTEPAEVAPASIKTRKNLALAMRHLRQNDLDSAGQLLEQAEVQQELERWSSVCPVVAVREMLSNHRLSVVQLNQVLQLELALKSGESPQPPSETDRWSQLADQPGSGWIQLPDFATITEFDPEKTLFRNGEWVNP